MSVIARSLGLRAVSPVLEIPGDVYDMARKVTRRLTSIHELGLLGQGCLPVPFEGLGGIAGILGPALLVERAAGVLVPVTRRGHPAQKICCLEAVYSFCHRPNPC